MVESSVTNIGRKSVYRYRKAVKVILGSINVSLSRTSKLQSTNKVSRCRFPGKNINWSIHVLLESGKVCFRKQCLKTVPSQLHECFSEESHLNGCIMYIFSLRCVLTIHSCQLFLYFSIHLVFGSVRKFWMTLKDNITPWMFSVLALVSKTF